MKGPIFVLAAMLAGAGLATVARADPVGDKDAGIAASREGDYDTAIRLFTHGLDAATQGERPDLLVMRGFAYQETGQFAQAIDDYTEVLKLKPDAVQVHFRRSIAYREMGEYDRSLADLNAVAGSSSHPLPEAPFFFGERGVDNFALGRFAAAAQDFSRVLALDPGDQYAALWRYVAQGRAGARDTYELARQTARVRADEWPHPLVLLYLGTATRAQALGAASGGDPDAHEDRRCEAAFFIGEYTLLQGDANGARNLLHDAANCRASLSVHAGAVGELARLGK